MAEITIQINNRNYSVACDDGQEGRVLELTGYVDNRVREIAGAGAATADSHLLVLTSLMIADEAFDLRDAHNAQNHEIQQLQNKIGHLENRILELEELLTSPGESGEQPVQVVQAGLAKEDEEKIVHIIQHLASRIDSVAERLQAA